MKKTVTGIVIAIIVLFLGLATYLYSPHTNLIPVLTPTPTSAPIHSFCNTNDLQALITLSPGAGNVYGTLTVKNIGTKPCQIEGENYVNAKYDTQAVKNISIEHQGTAESSMYAISPNQSLYSQIHYPNGPQCSDRTIATPVTFAYSVSPNNTIDFVNNDNSKTVTVNTCLSNSEVTTIQIWNLSSTPITN